METTSLYFFSTIPQVLAAIVGIIGAFHIFRNQSIKESLISYAIGVHSSGARLLNHNFIQTLKVLYEEIAVKKFEQIEYLFIQLEKLREEEELDSMAIQMYDDMKRFIDKYNNLNTIYIKRQRQFNFTFYVAVIIIFISLVFLMLSSGLNDEIAPFLYTVILCAFAINLLQVFAYIKISE